MEPVRIVTAQHAARAHALHEKMDALHDLFESTRIWVYSKLVQPSLQTAELTEKAANVERSDKKSALSREIMRTRVQLRTMRHDMSFVQLQTKLDELKSEVEALRVWNQMAPLLDSCPE